MLIKTWRYKIGVIAQFKIWAKKKNLNRISKVSQSYQWGLKFAKCIPLQGSFLPSPTPNGVFWIWH